MGLSDAIERLINRPDEDADPSEPPAVPAPAAVVPAGPATAPGQQLAPAGPESLRHAVEPVARPVDVPLATPASLSHADVAAPLAPPPADWPPPPASEPRQAPGPQIADAWEAVAQELDAPDRPPAPLDELDPVAPPARPPLRLPEDLEPFEAPAPRPSPIETGAPVWRPALAVREPAPVLADEPVPFAFELEPEPVAPPAPPPVEPAPPEPVATRAESGHAGGEAAPRAPRPAEPAPAADPGPWAEPLDARPTADRQAPSEPALAPAPEPAPVATREADATPPEPAPAAVPPAPPVAEPPPQQQRHEPAPPPVSTQDDDTRPVPALPPASLGFEELERAATVVESLGLGYHLGSAIERIVLSEVRTGPDEVPTLREAIWLIERHIELAEADAAVEALTEIRGRLARNGDVIAGLQALSTAVDARRTGQAAPRPARAAARHAQPSAAPEPAPATGRRASDAPTAEPEDEPSRTTPRPPRPADDLEDYSLGRELTVMAVRFGLILVVLVVVILVGTLVAGWR